MSSGRSDKRRAPATAGDRLAGLLACVLLTFVAGLITVAAAQPVPASLPPDAPAPPEAVPAEPDSAANGSLAASAEDAPPLGEQPYSYNPSGRRDPFAAIVLDGQKPGVMDVNLPPLQRASLTELTLIGIIWGSFGYTAMVQTPDGKGYSVRPGTKMGPNNGVVSAITENSLVVQERFTDVYGKKQVREYVKLLHPKENTE